MTSHILSSELNVIIQESRKKHADLKSATEQALRELKALPATSDSQLAADLQRRPHFVNPLLAACKSKNLKIALASVTCFQRLIVSTGLAGERLRDVLEGFQDCLNIGLEVQLRILQSLPSLLHNYSHWLEDDLQASVLKTCTNLQQAKATSVASTASATLQQAVSSLFEKVEQEDGVDNTSAPTYKVADRDGSAGVRIAAYDSYRTLEDICLMIEGQSPKFIRRAILSPAFGLELVETVLLNHAEVFQNHKELTFLLSNKVMTVINRILTGRSGFPVTIRATRVFSILLREHLSAIRSECEITLSQLIQNLENDGTTVWRSVLSMEVFKMMFSSPDLIATIYSTFHDEKGNTNPIQNTLATFVRLAAEKPSVIGLGTQSTTPSAQTTSKSISQEQAVVEAGNAAGLVRGDVGVGETNVPGISARWSSVKVPCMDQLDKTTVPTFPETYLYSLVLTCVTSLSEMLAKAVLPVAIQAQRRSGTTEKSVTSPIQSKADLSDEVVSTEEPINRPGVQVDRKIQARSVLPNPLATKDYGSRMSIRAFAKLIDECWPPVLACLSTFLYAALDSDYYRGLVRSIQKFTQTSGVLRLSTPRDAFLATLAKASSPPNCLPPESLQLPTTSGANLEANNAATVGPSLGSESFQNQLPSDHSMKSRRSSVDGRDPHLTQRHLMCLRALVNLAIVLGPILEDGWGIVLDCIQKSSSALAKYGSVATAHEYSSTQQSESTSQPTLGAEIAAVENAVTRLFYSTSEYPDDAFGQLLLALTTLIRDPNDCRKPLSSRTSPRSKDQEPLSESSATATLTTNSQFYISKVGQLANINIKRLVCDPPPKSWELLTNSLVEIAISPLKHDKVRLMSVGVICSVVTEAIGAATNEDDLLRGNVDRRCLSTLQSVVSPVVERRDRQSDTHAGCDIHVLQSILECLKSILEHHGDSLVVGWDTILDLVGSIFMPDSADHPKSQRDADKHPEPLPSLVSNSLLRSAFTSTQLICSEFLDTIPKPVIPSLISLLGKFSAQRSDVNTSLTTITLFWNIADYFQRLIKVFDLSYGEEELSEDSTEALLEDWSRKGSYVALWMVLQRHLASATSDLRADVRNGALHTTFRTFESCGDQFTSCLWDASLQMVLFNIIRRNIQMQQVSRDTACSQDSNDINPLNESSKILLQGIIRLITAHLEEISRLPHFLDFWHSLLEFLAAYLDCGSYFLNQAVFEALHSLLATNNDLSLLNSQAVNGAASLWARNIPCAQSSLENDDAVQDKAFIAYADAIKEIYGLLEAEISGQRCCIILSRIQECINASCAPPYTNDVSVNSRFQNKVLECIRVIKKDPSSTCPKKIRILSDFVRLPFRQESHTPNNRGLTFVSFSKSCVELLREMLIDEANRPEIYGEGAVDDALDALSQCIERQYTWDIQGPEPSLWRTAVTASISIFPTLLSALNKLRLNPDQEKETLSRIIKTTAAIQNAAYDQAPPDNALVTDESFDLESVIAFRPLLSAYLSPLGIPSVTRSAYIHSLAASSIIHKSRFDTFPAFTPDLNIYACLNDIQKIRLGRVCDPAVNPRLQMCYSCLDELYDFISTTKSQSAAPMAEAALPYFILRCAYPLKTYIADRPLRGRIPTPISQRRELQEILRKISNLRCSETASEALRKHCHDLGDGRDEAVPDVKLFVADTTRIHLEYLAPLIHRALEVAGSDHGTTDELRNALKVVL